MQTELLVFGFLADIHGLCSQDQFAARCVSQVSLQPLLLCVSPSQGAFVLFAIFNS